MTKRDESRPDIEPTDSDELRAFGDLVGDAVLRDPDGAAWRDERFVAWFFAEARERDRASRRMSDDEVLARGAAMRERIHARQLGVRRRGAPDRDVPDELSKRGRRSGARLAPDVTLGVAAGVGRELWDEPAESWVVVPDGLPDGDYLSLRVSGTSMTPLLHDGDSVLVRRGADVKPESVIVARHPDDGYVCKRVAGVRRSRIELASLEPGRSPIVIPRDPSLILGTVLLVWCPHRS